MAHLCYLCLVFVMISCRFIAALCSSAGKGLTSWPLFVMFENEPRHEISNNVVCATNKGSDQPAHVRSLIGAFACCLNIL